MNKIITRFAPSPTGFVHAGTYRTAIFSYLYAKKMNGEFHLRIEDTDKKRYKKEYQDSILASLNWMGIVSDKTFIQSENIEYHKSLIQKLLDEDKAYISKEATKDNTEIFNDLIRFKNKGIKITFHDLIRGEITIDTTDLGDFVIARNINDPLFHLVVVADDIKQGVTHIIRGDDHISNTPRQILIYQALGAQIPHYAHLPLVLGEDRSKLSKRKGALNLYEYKKLGYLKEALINFITFIGFNPGGEKEIYSIDELINVFDLSKIQKGGAVFNPKKLDWYNSEYIKAMNTNDYLNYAKSFIKEYINTEKTIPEEILNKILIENKNRIINFKELESVFLTDEFDYLYNDINNNIGINNILKHISIPEKMKKDKVFENNDIKNVLKDIFEILNNSNEINFTNSEKIKELIWNYAEEKGRGFVLWPLRVALTGKEKSFDPFTTIYILGKEKSINRLKFVIDHL